MVSNIRESCRFNKSERVVFPCWKVCSFKKRKGGIKMEISSIEEITAEIGCSRQEAEKYRRVMIWIDRTFTVRRILQAGGIGIGIIMIIVGFRMMG
jgi:hypothetical protein